MTKSDLIDISCTLVHSTSKAWLINDGKREVWIPKSVGEMEQQRDMTYVLTLPERWAFDKGLI